jgi:DNA damage-binding protein 1
LLFVCTARYKFALLSYDAARGTIVTEANGDVRDLVGREAKSHMSVVDDACSMIGLHMYEGVFKVIPMPFSGTSSASAPEAFNVKFDELNVLDIKMLPGGTGGKPTVVVLHEDSDGFRHVKTYVIDVSDRNLVDGPWNQPTVEAGASFLIPVPAPTPGVLIVGLETITFHDGRNVKTVRMPAMYPRAYGKLDADGSRHLLADQAGNLYVVVLVRDTDSVSSIVVEKIGDTAIASTLSYLDNGFVFVGSAFGDSQLIKLNADSDDSPVTVMETYLSLGPIVDACVVDLDRQGQCQVVTCSGAFKNASLRVVRSGIGVEEQAVIDLEGIKNIWSLRKSFESPFDTYLVQSYVSETRVFGIEGEEMEERTFEALISDVSSLYCGNAVHDTIVQVTPSEVRLLQHKADNTLVLVTVWSPGGSARITVASGNATQILVALTGGNVVLLEVTAPAGAVSLSKVGEAVLPHEVSCVSLQPLPSVSDDSDAVTLPLSASFAAIGLWKDASVRLVSLPALTELTAVSMKSDAQARSVLLTVMQRTAYLLVGTADGHLVSHKLAAEAGGLTLTDAKKVSLGSQPVILSQFHSKGAVSVFACCDRPTVVYSAAAGKLLYSNVNLTEVNVMTSFHSESFPECLALASGTQLTIGTIDDIQKLHVKTVPLPGEQSRRIAHHKPTRTLVVLTSASVLTASGAGSSSEGGGYIEKCFLKLFDDTTFELLHSLELEDAEQALALVCMKFLEDDTEYVVVGSSYVLEDEEEPSKGKLAVYTIVVDGEGVVDSVSDVVWLLDCSFLLRDRLRWVFRFSPPCQRQFRGDKRRSVVVGEPPWPIGCWHQLQSSSVPLGLTPYRRRWLWHEGVDWYDDIVPRTRDVSPPSSQHGLTLCVRS